MADPLSQLRQFHVNKREIKEINGFIIFGENGWPKNVKTNYQICQSKTNKEYYTLECLLYFLKNQGLSHHFYVKKAAQDNVPAVHRPDRKDLLSYLTGENNTSQNIDRNAPIPASTSIQQESGDNRSMNLQRPNQDYKRLLDRFAASLDEPKLKKPELTASTSANELAIAELGPDKLAEIRGKRLAKKRSTIIDADTEIGLVGKSGTSQKDSSAAKEAALLIEYDQRLMDEIKKKEKIWRTRSSMLQAHSKNFAKSVLPLIQAIAKMDDASFKKTTANNNQSPIEVPIMKQPPSTQTAQYSRYDQERFANPSDATLGFNIDTRQTYHGKPAGPLSQPVVNGSNGLPGSQKLPGPPAGMNSYSNIPSNNRGHVMSVTGHSTPSNSANKRRQSRVPIIIIPATTTSLVNMYNAQAILQDLKFVEGKADSKRDSELLIQRKKPDGTSSAYRVIDNPIKLDQDDWNRVVAVFVQGPSWQFKGWPWGGAPVEIFSRIKAFHLKFDEMKIDANVAKWNVHVIELSRSKRHLDKANLLKFWSSLDSHMMKNKKNLKF